MNDILSLDIGEMTGYSFDCSCGRRHSVDIKKIILGSNTLPKIIDFASEYGKKIFMVADTNTYKVYGKKIEEELRKNDFDLKSHVFDTPNSWLVPDEKAIGRMLVEIEPDTQLIIAVGSGSLNDLSRLLSCKTHIPYCIVCTAPSMDGYASIVSPLIIDHFKVSYDGVYPSAIIADTEIVNTAPMEMVRAGFGDIIGKYTALTDWVLSREVNGEYYCETCVELINNAIKKCTDNIDGIAKRDETAVKYIMYALILSGVAIGLAGCTRPASGTEHLFSHYWEMDALKNGREHPLHGNSVGTATVIVASIYDLLKEDLPAACTWPKPEEIAVLLRKVGAADSPKTLGISRDLFKASVLYAKDVRPRYSVLKYAAKVGKLEEIADVLTRKFYGD